MAVLLVLTTCFWLWKWDDGKGCSNQKTKIGKSKGNQPSSHIRAGQTSLRDMTLGWSWISKGITLAVAGVNRGACVTDTTITVIHPHNLVEAIKLTMAPVIQIFKFLLFSPLF